MGGDDGAQPSAAWLGDKLALAQCGIGNVNAAAATLLIDCFGAKSLVLSGVAAGLNSELAVGAVLLPTASIPRTMA